MVQTNKILTVSYGTFSCTLEGFDDSFGTMKAIANYFHDLAAEDRYFGAEPPQPDAELLARIAQREISRRVEARQGEDGIVLRAADAPAALPPVGEIGSVAPQDARPAPDAPAARRDPEPAPQAETETRAPEETAEDPEIESDSPDPEIIDAAPEEGAWPATDQLAELMPEPQMRASAAQDSITVKLQRIRAVVTRNRLAAQSADFSEDEHAEAMFTAFDDGLTEAIADHDEPGAELEGAHEAALETHFDDDDADDGSIEAEAAVDIDDTDDRNPAAETDGLALLEATDACGSRDAELKPDDTDSATQSAESIADGGNSALQPRTPQDTAGAPTEAEPDAIDAPGSAAFSSSRKSRGATIEGGPVDDSAQDKENDAPPSESVGPDDSVETETDALVAATASNVTLRHDDPHPKQGDPSAPAPRPHMLRLKRADVGSAMAAGSPPVAGKEGTRASAPQDDGDEDLIRGLLGTNAPTGKEAATNAQIADEVADLPPDTAESQSEEIGAETDGDHGESGDALLQRDRPYLLVNRCDTEVGTSPAPSSTEIATETNDETRPSSTDQDGNLAMRDANADKAEDGEDGYDLADASHDARQIAEPESLGEPDEDIAEPEPDHRDADTTRLMSVAQGIMNEPQSASTRETHSRLRAAAATTKKGLIGASPNAAEDDEIYRRDLASFVRPRRPVTAPRSAERPGSAERPAPLKLVQELRVDGPAGARPSGPIRPRRIMTTPGEDIEAAETGAGDSDFVSFAETMGATELPDLLEAAAAYLSFVEGRAQFSRPQLMKRVREVEIAGFNREDGLRSFGLLLRAGKIEKAGSGRFTVSDEIGFRPGPRMN
ncbi:MAG: hypothetical protein KDK29_07015 [Sedimentitalea sp.]|nr:hypothetical protein [Sedimentitalea sp.]